MQIKKKNGFLRKILDGKRLSSKAFLKKKKQIMYVNTHSKREDVYSRTQSFPDSLT